MQAREGVTGPLQPLFGQPETFNQDRILHAGNFMTWGRSYRLSKITIIDLKNAGVDETIMMALRALDNSRVYDRKSFDALLAGIGPRKIGEAEHKLIRKFAQLGLLRLEKIIPYRSAREWAEALIFAVVIALGVRTFLIAPFKIPSGSMIPTIAIGDHIFATMFSYGIPVPFTDIKLLPGKIERGDIVIFPYPENPEVDYIKRVVATGGEKVFIKNDQVFIDGKPLKQPYAYFDPSHRLDGDSKKSNYMSLNEPTTVPAGKLFVMGDNRYNSADSRYWGFVDEKTVKGRGWIIYFSHDPAAGWLSGYRLGRIASTLE